jgi:hypothetical protein
MLRPERRGRQRGLVGQPAARLRGVHLLHAEHVHVE